MTTNNDQSVWLTRDQMREICPSCADEMVSKNITRLKIADRDGEILQKAGFSQGLCDKFGGATGFRTRCMDSSIASEVSDIGAFCNKLKIYCHGSAGAESKTQKIVVKNDKARYTLGVVYEPDTDDTDNEFAKAEDIEKACWDFMRNIQGRSEAHKAAMDLVVELSKAVKEDDEVEIEIDEALDDIAKRGVNAMHKEDLEDCEIVECYIAPADMVIGKEVVKKGSWLAGIVWDEPHFEKIENGEWNGYSMGGWAKKEDG